MKYTKKQGDLASLEQYMFSKLQEFSKRQTRTLLPFRTNLTSSISAVTLALACTISAVRFYYKFN